MISLRTTTQSFDLFDTLIARACITPANLFGEVENALGAAGFASARMAAEQRVFAAGEAFDLPAIYRELGASGYCDAVAARRLMAAEIDAEFDNAIPVAENLAAVRDFDLVISDMYLPAAILRGLLQHVGLRRFVHLFVSNAGKFQGSIWPQLTRNWLILRHIGDHAQADLTQPQRFGIPATLYAGATPSPLEQSLENAGLPLLGRLARRMRLANPYHAGTVEAGLWQVFAEFNTPLLCLAACEARKRRDAVGKHGILFLARDGHFLSEIFLALYPDEPSALIHVSRAALAADPAGFARYFEAHDLENALVCDLVSTGLSWLRFSQSSGRPIDFYTLVHIDNYQYQAFDPAELNASENYRFSCSLRSSELDPWSLAIELINTAPHGTTVALDPVGATLVPRFAAHHELPVALLKCLTLAHAAAIQNLRRQRVALAAELAQLDDTQELLAVLVSTLSSTPWINHLASDAICRPTN